MDGRALVKRWAMSLATLIRLDASLRHHLQKRGQAVIVNLHRVSPQTNPYWSPLSPSLFDDLLTYISRHFYVTTFAGMAEPHDRPALVLSFDDGYKDFVDYAMPILARHRMPVNQNVIPACVESGLPPWNVALYDFLAAAPTSLLRDLTLPGFHREPPADDASSKAHYGLALSRYLKNRPRHDRLALWEPIRAVMDRADVTYTPMMTQAEIRQLAGDCTFGAHSYSHESMGFESMAFFADDTRQCQTYFADSLGLPLTIYAFPNGSHRPEQITYLREQGLEHILLVGERLASPTMPALPRLTIYGDSLSELVLRTTGLFADKAAS